MSTMQATSENLEPINGAAVHLLGFMCVAAADTLEPEIIEGPNGPVKKFTISYQKLLLSHIKVPYTYDAFVRWAMEQSIADFSQVTWAEPVFDQARKFLMFAAERKQDFVLHFAD